MNRFSSEPNGFSLKISQSYFNGKIKKFKERPITQNSKCSFMCLGEERDKAIKKLLLRSGDTTIRNIVAPEIIETMKKRTKDIPKKLLTQEVGLLFRGYLEAMDKYEKLAKTITDEVLGQQPNLEEVIGHRSPEQLLQWLATQQKVYGDEHQKLCNLRTGVAKAEYALMQWAKKESVFKLYVKSYLTVHGKQWLTIMPNTKGEGLGIIDAIVKVKNISGVCVWALNQKGTIIVPIHNFGNSRRRHPHV